MKKLLMAVLVLLASAGIASAASFADIDESQAQFDGGIAAATPLFSGHIAGAVGVQEGVSISAAEFGDSALTSSSQIQAQSGLVSEVDTDNFSSSRWETFQSQEAATGSFGGIAVEAQSQVIAGGTAGLSVGGQFAVAGSAGYAEAEAGSAALGLAGAYNTQEQGMVTAYEQQSVSPNGGFIYQTGEQEFSTSTTTGALFIGIAGAEASVFQFGGSVLANDGQGGFMDSQASAYGEASASTGSLGIAGAGAEALGTQTHTYEQYNVSADMTSQQFASGTVTTTVQASD